MRIFTALFFLSLLNIANLYSQSIYHQHYYVEYRAIEPHEYDGSRVQKNSYKILNQEQTIQVLGDSIETYEVEYEDSTYQYIEKLQYRNGKVYVEEANETEITAYYPELGLIILGDFYGETVMDINTGEILHLHGNPKHNSVSPSQEYRITSIGGSEMCVKYYLDKKANGTYGYLGDLRFNKAEVKGIYWEDDTHIYYLAKNRNDSKYWIPYRGTIKPDKVLKREE